MISQPVRLSSPVGGRTSSQTAVAPIASAIPPADSRLPLRAVAGEFIRIRPSTNATAPASQTSRTMGSTTLGSTGYASVSPGLGATGLRLNIWSIRSVTT
jgi:hypothetical protein